MGLFQKKVVAETGTRGMSKGPTPPKLQVLFTIVNRDKAELYLALLQGFDINMQMSLAARGTADAEMLQYLGLSDAKKSVIISVIREDRADAVLRFLEEKFDTIKNGKGIAFTVPMTSLIGALTYRFLGNMDS